MKAFSTLATQPQALKVFPSIGVVRSPPTNMDDGLLEINLLPAWDSPNVRLKLKSALSRSQLLQAAVAYWTVNDKMFGSCLPRALSHASGFLCVDLHPPTDIDALASLVRQGSHVRLYCEDISTYTDDGRKEPPYLLHAKMLLFWSNDRTAELWIGSHNWTNRAILGLNVEASIVLRLRDSAGLFCTAANYLEKIKTISDSFDLSKVDFYKQLQRNMSAKTVPVIELEAKAAASLGNTTVGLFGTDDADLKELGTIQRDVYTSIFDTDSGKEFLYPSTILHSGVLAASNPSAGGISFSPRRQAYRQGRRFPILLPEGEVSNEVLRTAVYFVTLHLQGPDSSVTAEYPATKTAAWDAVGEQLSPLLRRLDPDARNILFRRREPRLRHPVRLDTQESVALTLAEKRLLPEKRLVSRRILRPKN